MLDKRFAVLKGQLVKPEHKQRVIESYKRLLKLLELEVQRIERHGSALVPEIDFSVIRENGESNSDLISGSRVLTTRMKEVYCPLAWPIRYGSEVA